ncbi:FixH family protein [Corallococcus sp. BB11-1]|uniref:FixH family protein n=1 Tax=Corallococcus sp. BB11-1 TaxID=2996783 RepID=UPI00226FB421|nr:FixH family protein [Corallococcus sp. BB11-1]MCY1033072.1 FixH family protein [Corallococcus sp. BB11-1]
MMTLLVWMMLLGALPPAGPSAGNDAGTVGTVAAVATVTSASGRLRVELRSASVPLRRGVQVFQVRISDAASGRPVPGVILTVQPWMPSMGHGISETPRITEREPGVFEVSELDLFMPGAWEMRFTLKGTVEDTATVALKLGR